jgi:hypothetical protein
MTRRFLGIPLGWFQGEYAKDVEIAVLRHQLEVLPPGQATRVPALWAPDISVTSCDLRTLMDQPTQPIPSHHPPSRHGDR